MSDARAVEPPYVAEMLTVVDAVTAVVVTVNVAVVEPAATVTLPGTEATDGVSLDRVTPAPPVGAGPLSVTVPVDGLTPVTLVGFSVREATVTGGGGGGGDVVGPSAQNSKKLSDHPVPSPTLLVSMRRYLAC